MSKARKDLIDKAFKKLDRTGDGYITFEDLKDNFDVTHHPKFKSGEMTRAKVHGNQINPYCMFLKS